MIRSTLLITMNKTHISIAKNLEKLMSYRRLTQVELAKKTGVSQRTISNMLNPGSVGSITTGSLEKVSEYFKIEPYHLLIEDLPIEVLISSTIEKVINYYAKSSEEGRENINRIAEMAANYTKKNQQLTTEQT